MTELCLNKNNLDQLFSSLNDQYNKGIVAQLTDEELQFVTETALELKTTLAGKGVNIDESKFVELIKRIYPVFQNQSGGDDNDVALKDEQTDEDTVTVYNSQRPSRGASIYDLISIVGLFVSLFLIYVSFLQFNSMICHVTQMKTSEISQDLVNQVQTAIDAVKNLPRNEMTFLTYIYNRIGVFSQNIVMNQVSRIQSIITVAINSVVIDVTSNAKEICLPRQVLTESGLANSLINQVSNIVSLSSSQSQIQTVQCVADMTTLLTTQALNNRAIAIQLLMKQITTSSTQIQSTISYASYLGTASSSYLVLRISQLRGQKLISNRGGKVTKSRKHKKSKQSKKSNKSKKSKKSKK